MIVIFSSSFIIWAFLLTCVLYWLWFHICLNVINADVEFNSLHSKSLKNLQGRPHIMLIYYWPFLSLAVVNSFMPYCNCMVYFLSQNATLVQNPYKIYVTSRVTLLVTFLEQFVISSKNESNFLWWYLCSLKSCSWALMKFLLRSPIPNKKILSIILPSFCGLMYKKIQPVVTLNHRTRFY